MTTSDPNRRSPLWMTLQPIARVFFASAFDAHVYGLENIPATGAAILAANHQSFLDPPLVAAPLSRPVSFMAKSELFENRLFGGLIRNLHAFPIRQGRGDRGAIMETVKRLDEGYLLNIYPEGSRSEDGEIAALLPGIALVIRKAQVPVVPTAIHGTFGAWPAHRRFFKPHPVRLAYGPALRLHDLPSAEILQVLDRVLRTMLEDLRAFPSGSAGSPITTRVSPAPRELLAYK